MLAGLIINLPSTYQAQGRAALRSLHSACRCISGLEAHEPSTLFMQDTVLVWTPPSQLAEHVPQSDTAQ